LDLKLTVNLLIKIIVDKVLINNNINMMLFILSLQITKINLNQFNQQLIK